MNYVLCLEFKQSNKEIETLSIFLLFSHNLKFYLAGLDPEEVLEGIIQGHDRDPAPIDDLGAGLTAEIIAGGTATAILPCPLEGVMLGIG